MAYPVTSTEILAGSEFVSNGSANPSTGRSKLNIFDMIDDDSDANYVNIGFDIYEE